MTEPTPKLSNIEIRNLISMRVFRYTCLICAILLTFRCINLFVRNKDVAEIKFFEYHEDDENIYPSITFCHRHPFIGKFLKKYDMNLSINSYKAFLKGDCRTYSNESITCGKYHDEVDEKFVKSDSLKLISPRIVLLIISNTLASSSLALRV